MSSSLIRMKTPVAIRAASSVAGEKEWKGPLGQRFDLHSKDDRFGKETWEQAESEMQRLAFHSLLQKFGCEEKDIDAVFAGDLINQCTSSAYGLLEADIPFFGLYGACSTGAEGMILSSLLLQSGLMRRLAVVTSSHNCSAERQFRLPVEYGGQRPPTAQWTVTAAAGFLLETDNGRSGYVRITEVLPGRTYDYGIKDANNMGAAMAPAAADTLFRYFLDSGRSPAEFDRILTGDLGYEGSGILTELLRAKGILLGARYSDCGLLIYDRVRQDVHAGGSGCGCSTAVLAADILPKLRCGFYRHVLWMGTGALMSPMMLQQGQSIPGICHLLHLEAPPEVCI